MLKKILQILFVLLLVIFSFYYTDKAIVLLEQKDPIMKQLKEIEPTYYEAAQDATINNQYITPGYNGKKIDLEKSFQKMKQYGAYNDTLLVFEETKPTISIDEYYDHYISSGNGFTNNIALVFKVKPQDDITTIKNILDENNVRGTFFIDGLFLDEHAQQVMDLVKDFHEVELLSYDNTYNEQLFTASLSKLQTLTNTKPNYCYAEYDQKEVLELCQKNNLHTIIPTAIITANPYKNLKQSLKSGKIISLTPTTATIKELPVVIHYIKQKGYTLDTLDNLLNEGRSFEK